MIEWLFLKLMVEVSVMRSRSETLFGVKFARDAKTNREVKTLVYFPALKDRFLFPTVAIDELCIHTRGDHTFARSRKNANLEVASA